MAGPDIDARIKELRATMRTIEQVLDLDRMRAEIADLFAYIEDVPRHLFDDSVPWTWSDYAGYRDTVNATGTGINLAALVGHSPIRLAVMGDDAWTRVATADERDAMAALLDDAMAAGRELLGHALDERVDVVAVLPLVRRHVGDGQRLGGHGGQDSPVAAAPAVHRGVSTSGPGAGRSGWSSRTSRPDGRSGRRAA